MHNFSGEIAALSAAFLWAASSAVYGIIGQKIPPLQLNFLKGIIAIALIVITLILREEITVTLQRSVGFLFLSGAIGIGLGDTAYFAALKSMGARKTLLIQTLAPPSAALLALIFLSEKLSYAAWCGILMCFTAVGCRYNNCLVFVANQVYASTVNVSGLICSSGSLAFNTTNRGDRSYSLWQYLSRYLVAADCT